MLGFPFYFQLSAFYFTGVCLPSDTKMTDDDLYRVCDVIKALWENEEVYKEKVSTSEVL